MIRLQPDWIGELVSICSSDDWSDASQPLDYPSVSPMFRKLIPDLAEADDVTGYSSAEVRACKAGIEWLSKTHPNEYRALAREFQPWKRKHLEATEHDRELAMHAGKLLAKFVDVYCGN